MFKILYVLRSPDSGTGGGDPNYETLLAKIGDLETRLAAVETENSNLKKQNEQIMSFNRQLLDRQPGNNSGNNDNNDGKAKEELDKYLKGE